MAANRDFTLKRNNGTDIDILLPTTHIGQIYTDATLTTTLQSVLNSKINSSEKGAANGVAPLDSNGKILYSDLPDGLYGGLNFSGSLSADLDIDTLGDGLPLVGEANNGSFWIATSNVVLTSGGKSTMLAPGDEGDYTFPITIEAGDWLVLTAYVIGTYQWVIVNNTTANATTTQSGTVVLSSKTSYSGMNGVANVITENVLFDIIGTGDLNGNTDSKIAGTQHTHSQYQPIDSDLTTLAGLAKTDGNIIVGNGSNWVTESGATARASLGLTIGTHVQAYDADLASIAALNTSLANNTDNLQFIYADGLNSYSIASVNAFSKNLLTAGDAAAFRSGISAQASSTYLTAIAGLARTDGNFIVGNGSTWVAESGATARASLGVYSFAEINDLLANRPEIFYNTTVGSSAGDYIIDLN